MITYTVKRPAHGDNSGGIVNYIEGSCISTDTKPDDVANGSIMMEMDTSTLYMFDENAGTWRAWA